MNVPKGNIVTRRNFLRLGVAGVGTAAVGLFLINKKGVVDYSDPAYLYWNKKSQGSLNLENYLVLCASLAPSAHNTQPWKFSIRENHITLMADLKRNLGAADKERRMMLISLGAALENIRIAAEQLGVETTITLQAGNDFLQTGLAANIDLAVNSQPKHPAGGLFDSIFTRQTTRMPYAETPVADTAISTMNNLNNFSNLSVHWFNSSSDRQSIAALSEEAVKAFTKDDAAYLDSLNWWRYSREEILQKRDGISIFTSAAPTLIKQYFQYEVNQKDMSGDFGKQGEIDLMTKLFTATPQWGAITSHDINNTSRLQAGQLFERVFLSATQQGLRIQPVNYVSEQEVYARRFKEKFNIAKDDDLLVVFRIGSSELCERAVRRPLDEIIV